MAGEHVDPTKPVDGGYRPVVPPRVRDYLYPIALAGSAVAMTYGLLTAEEAAAWVGLAAAALGLGTATAYRPRRTQPPSDG